MKTFRLMSLQLVTADQELIPLPLEDGLIINKEDEKNRWLIEAFISDGTFRSIEASLGGKVIHVLAVISKKENDPVLFETSLCSAGEVDGGRIVLFEGVIKKGRSRFAELLLEDLVSKGLTGDQLVQEFKEKIHSKPAMAALRE
ncbi:YwpF family protein [Peribacillus sp. SCS-26]|uniref:YwpF family protein n=1 Tax=Paraperibacillus marinus TaxID=3115295 RepID=UPI00390677DD